VMMLSDVCLTSDVCGVHPVGGRRVRPAGWIARIGLLGPGSAGLAQGCHCELPLQAWAGHIVAAARLQLV